MSLERRGAQLAIEAADADPSWIHPAWPGKLSGTATLAATFAPAFLTRFDALDLSGELRRYPVKVGGAAEVTAGDHWRLAPLRVDSGPNVIVLDGELDSESSPWTSTRPWSS